MATQVIEKIAAGEPEAAGATSEPAQETGRDPRHQTTGGRLRRSRRRRSARLPGEATGASMLAAGLCLLATLILLFGAFLFLGSSLAAERRQDVMYDDLTEQLAQATVPVSGVIPTGTALGLVQIPRLGIEQVFVEGSASEQTAVAPGLPHDSVLPGQTGVSVLVGRRSTFGAPFADLDDLRSGDRILVTTGQGQFTYVVDLVRTSDAPAVEIEQVPARLTLVTSDPAVAPSRTLMVSAQLAGEALPASTGTGTVPDDVPGSGSTGRGVALLLWSQLLLITAGVVTWAALRLPGRALWIGATPVLLAILWNVFENLAVLLPNTL